MKCENCKYKRVIEITAKCNDCFFAWLGDKEYDGYVVEDIGIGGGDNISFALCLNYGMHQGEFPKPECSLEIEEDGEDLI